MQKETMTELLDELFEHPKAAHDDLTDALYYANYFAWNNPPRSESMDIHEFDEYRVKIKSTKPTKKRYNWMTGATVQDR